MGTGGIGRAHTDASGAGAGAGPAWWGLADMFNFMPVHHRCSAWAARGVSHPAGAQLRGAAQGAPARA